LKWSVVCGDHVIVTVLSLTHLGTLMIRQIVFLALLVAAMYSTCAAQEPTGSQTPSDFRSRERRIEVSTQEDYHEAREVLAKEALLVAGREIESKEAEELLHWIVKGGGNTETAKIATERLIEHHAASPASIRKLLSYAINPTGCTPKLFAGFKRASVSDGQHWIVLASSAIHQKSLLLVADELVAGGSGASQYHTQLGSELIARLVKEDPKEFEAQVIARFRDLSTQHGEKSIGGMTIKELAEGAIFAVQHLRLGKVAKGLSGKTLDGKVVKIEDFRGKVLLINFWATWCAPCATAVPDLKELSRELPLSQFAIFGVSVDEDDKKLQEFIKENAVAWDNIVDRNGVLQKRWQSLSLPTYYVLDTKGVIRFRGTDHFGAMNAAKSIVGATLLGSASMPPVDEIARSILSAYDKNKDDRLEKTELPAEGQVNFEAADTNKDAALSLDEVILLLQNGNVTSKPVEVNPPTQKGDRTKP